MPEGKLAVVRLSTYKYGKVNVVMERHAIGYYVVAVSSDKYRWAYDGYLCGVKMTAKEIIGYINKLPPYYQTLISSSIKSIHIEVGNLADHQYNDEWVMGLDSLGDAIKHALEKLQAVDYPDFVPKYMSETCAHCLDNPPRYSFECGHLCICYDCMHAMQENECPICEQAGKFIYIDTEEPPSDISAHLGF